MASEAARSNVRSEELSASSHDGNISVYFDQRLVHGRTSGPTRRSTKGRWTPEEDAMLFRAVQRYESRNWKKIVCFISLE